MKLDLLVLFNSALMAQDGKLPFGDKAFLKYCSKEKSPGVIFMPVRKMFK